MQKRRFSHYRRRFSLAALVSPWNVSDCATSVPLFKLVVDPNRRHGLSCMHEVECMASSRFYSCWSTWWANSTPIDLKATDPSVLFLGRFPVGGFARAVTWKRLHPGHSFITLFVSLLRGGIQYFSRIFAIVKLTPSWRVWSWARNISLLLNKASSEGKWGSLPG